MSEYLTTLSRWKALLRPMDVDLIRKRSLLQVYKFWSLCSGLLLSIVYLLVLPVGLSGLALAIVAFGFTLAGVGKKSIGIYLLIFGPGTLGMVFQSFGIRYVGTLISVSMGFILLYVVPSTTTPRIRAQWRLPCIWLLVMILSMIFFYFRGPQTEYCQSKVLAFIVWLPIAVVALEYLAKSKEVSMWHIGLLGILSSVVFYAAILHLYPEVAPDNIWTSAGLKIRSNLVEQRVATINLSFGSIYGIIFLISSVIDKELKKNRLFLFALALCTGLLILNSAGQRLFWVLLPICSVTLILCRPRNKKLIELISFLTIIALVGIVWIGLRTENKYVVTAFGSDVEILDRFNRSENWLSAFSLIAMEPILGHGLGGYYIEHYSLPGSETYPHNLILELLCETGIIGTIAFLSPVIFFFLIPKLKYILRFRTASGGTFLPLLVATFLHAMISHDLTQSYRLFAILIVQWAYITSNIKSIPRAKRH